MSESIAMPLVLVTTEHRGVFVGRLSERINESTVTLKDARMVIRFGTTRGLLELCETGPTAQSKISAKADCEIRKVTAVFVVSPEAAAKWESIK